MLGALGVLAAFIWLRDLRWYEELGDSLPILAALPVFIALGWPWRLHHDNWRIATAPALLAAVLFPLGIAFDSGLVLAVAWTTLLWSWIAGRVVVRPGSHLRKLMLLPLLAFPWLLTDLERLAWWFRLSGAASAGDLLAFAGFTVAREGTFLWANDFAVSVEPACSGVNGLQSMLLAGAALAYVKLKGSALFWWNLPLLVGAAWLANLLRIVTATAAGALMSPEAAARWVDPLHSFAGWLALCVVFLLCYLIFTMQEDAIARGKSGGRSWFVGKPWLELTLLVYACWCARGLVSTWIWTPFDRFAWLAFALWLLPAVWPPRETSSRAMPDWFRHCLLAAGLAALLLGNVADVNFLYHVALAAIVTSFSRRAGYVIWAVGALSWLPASGWVASRFGVDPAVFAAVRVAAGLVTAVWGLGIIYRKHRETEQPLIFGPKLVPEKARHVR